MSGARRAQWALAGFLTGTALGLLAWSRQMRHCRQNLFSRSPLKRLAALGYLRGQVGSVELTRLLRDYVHWESRPGLRRRGQRLLRRMELHLS